MLLVYNKKLIPDPPQSWVELEQMAKDCTQDNEKYGIVLQGSSAGDWQYYEWCNFAYGHGGGVINKKYDWEEWVAADARLLVSEETIAATERYCRLLKYAPEGYVSTGHNQQQDAMLKGNIGMAVMWSDRLAEFCDKAAKNNQLQDFGFQKNLGGRSMNGTGTLFVPKGRDSRQVKRAARFVARTMDRTYQQRLMEHGYCPVFDDLYDKCTEETIAKYPFLPAVKESLTHSISMLESSRLGTWIRDTVQFQLKEIVTESCEASDGLEELRSAIVSKQTGSLS